MGSRILAVGATAISVALLCLSRPLGPSVVLPRRSPSATIWPPGDGHGMWRD